MNKMRSRSVDRSAGEPTIVMVVEDEFFVRVMIADKLRAAGFPVVECRDADEALEVLHSGMTVSLMFTDIRMPGSMDGVRLAQTVRDQFPALKIVFTSSELPPATVASAEQFVPKPYDPKSVIRRIDGLLKGTSSVPRG